MNTHIQNIYFECVDVMTSHGWYIIVIIAFCCILRSMFRKKNICVAKTENGNIVVTKSALQELIEFIARGLGAQGKIKVIVHSHRNNMNLDVILRSGDCNNLQEFSHSLREKLQEIIVEKIGINNLKKINITVSKFALNRNILFSTQEFEE